MPADNRNAPLDGLRGIAALVVMLDHYQVFAASFSSATNRFMNESVFSQVYLSAANGAFAVCIFFLISGYVLLIKYSRDPASSPLGEVALRRYFRLTPPILAAMLALYALQLTVGFYNVEAAAIIGGHDWLASIPPTTGIAEILYAGLTTVVTGYDRIDGVVWTMRVELGGSLLLFGLCALFYQYQRYWMVVLVSSVILWATIGVIGICLSLFLVGSLFLKYGHPRVHWLAIPLALYLGGTRDWSPLAVWLADFSWWPRGLFMPSVVVDALAALLLFTSILASEGVRRFLSLRLLRWLGRVSFSVYLIHVPVMCTIGCFVLVQVYGATSSMHWAALAGYTVSIVATFLLAEVLTRVVDLPSQKWAPAVARYLLLAGTATTPRSGDNPAPNFASLPADATAPVSRRS